MKYEININDDFADDITRLALINSFESIMADIKTAKAERKALRKAGKELPSYRYEDYSHDKMMKKALLKVIKYYSTPDQWHEFIGAKA